MIPVPFTALGALLGGVAGLVLADRHDANRPSLIVIGALAGAAVGHKAEAH